MVMVLLFLGVVFLLVGFNALRSGGDDDSASAGATTTVATAAPATSQTSAAATAKPDVRVFNLSEVAGLADQTATRLRDAQWNVT